MKRIAFQIILCLCDLVGLNKFFRARNSDKVRILMYHGVTIEKYHPVYWLMVHVDNFRAQMQHLARHYDVIPASQLLGIADTNSGGKAVITFDDGLENVHTVAKPVLEQLNLPALCFVVPGLSEKQEEIFSEAIFNLVMQTTCDAFDLGKFGLGQWPLPTETRERANAGIALNRLLKKQPSEKIAAVRKHLFSKYTQSGNLNSPFKLMDVDQIKQFASEKNFAVGAHTNDHFVLSSLSEVDQQYQIESSVQKIKDWGLPLSEIFCYPSGGFNESTVETLKQSGIKGAVTTTDGLHDPGDDRYRMKRISVGADTSIYEFKARMSGLYYWLIRLTGLDGR